MDRLTIPEGKQWRCFAGCGALLCDEFLAVTVDRPDGRVEAHTLCLDCHAARGLAGGELMTAVSDREAVKSREK